MQAFVSHSQKDKDIRQQFSEVFAVAGVKPFYMEFESTYPPSWSQIKNEMSSSELVFLLLGPNIRSSIHTQNWVAFEVGLACAFGKDVWVFEQGESSIEFPVPYLTDYMIYNLNVSGHFNYVRKVLEAYKRPIPIFPLLDHPRKKRNIPRGMWMSCGECGTNYALHTNITSYNCPSCRTPVTTKKRE